MITVQVGSTSSFGNVIHNIPGTAPKPRARRKESSLPLPPRTVTEVGVDAYDRSPYAYVRLYADYTYAGTLLIVTGEEVLGDES